MHRTFRLLLAVAALLPATHSLAGTNGTWTDSTSGGLWSASANWLNGAIANGTDSAADFSTLNIAADNTVHLDTVRTVGAMLFGDTTPSNNWLIDNNGNSADVLTLAVSSGSPTITVVDQSATISTSIAGTQGLAFNGPGTLSLSGANSLSGGVSANAGTLVLDYTSQNNNKFSTASSLTLSNAALTVLGNNSPFTQTVAGLTLGADTASTMNNASGDTTLALGAITRNAGATIDFSTGGSGANTTTTTNANFAGGTNTILGGWATFGGGSTWAVAGTNGTATSITGLTSFSSSMASGANVDASGIYAINSTTVNSVRFNNNSAATTVNIASNNTLIVATGGILETPRVGSNAIQFAGGNLTSGNGADLIVSQNNPTSVLTIGSAITGNIALVKTGVGSLSMTSTANNYSGGTIITGGTVIFSTGSQLSGPVTLNGGTIEWNNNNTPSAFSDTVMLGSNGGTILQSSGNDFEFQLTSP